MPFDQWILKVVSEAMSTFEADIAALRETASAATSLAEQAELIDLGELAGSIAGGMPGSRSAAATPELAEAWTERLRSWAAHTRGYGTQVTRCADLYETSEEAAAAAFRGTVLLDWLPTWR